MTIKRTTHEHDTHEISEQIEQKQHFHIFHHESRDLKINFDGDNYDFQGFDDRRHRSCGRYSRTSGKAPLIRKTGSDLFTSTIHE